MNVYTIAYVHCHELLCCLYTFHKHPLTTLKTRDRFVLYLILRETSSV